MSDSPTRCPCGEAHELSAAVRAEYESVTAGLASSVPVKIPGVGCWLVPRIYVAVHGLRAQELPALAERYGFEAQPALPRQHPGQPVHVSRYPAFLVLVQLLRRPSRQAGVQQPQHGAAKAEQRGVERGQGKPPGIVRECAGSAYPPAISPAGYPITSPATTGR